ncbi:unnamed protein product, partial [Mycena citricolor]
RLASTTTLPQPALNRTGLHTNHWNRENRETGCNLSPLAETNDTLSQWLGCFNECIQFVVVFRWSLSSDPYVSARDWLPNRIC